MNWSHQACTDFLKDNNQAAILSYAEAMSRQNVEAAVLEEKRASEIGRMQERCLAAKNMRDLGLSEDDIKKVLGNNYCVVGEDIIDGNGGEKRGAVSTIVTPPTKKKSRKDPRSSGLVETGHLKTIEGRDGFDKLNQSEKLAYMNRVYDPIVKVYINPDRLFLLRINKIVACYRNCCGSNEDAFNTKFCNKKGTWSVTTAIKTVKECVTCQANKASKE